MIALLSGSVGIIYDLSYFPTNEIPIGREHSYAIPLVANDLGILHLGAGSSGMRISSDLVAN